ncbi:GNAT family N-acetyltransferase [Nonomuraea sp. NPDC050556]|uniref:GNAT family N-acetyltransferase n=1 Tax=Nonomuraea sp. NPDC050556 TaxID=3364369 RepID=UPI00379B9091
MTIRRLGPDELPACQKLEQDRDWGTDAAKWQLMFDAGEVYGVDAPDGDGLAACVVLSVYGEELAAVGMMLVATRYGRQGLGTLLMRHALDRAGSRVVELTATRFGRPVYERLGFTVTGGLTVMTGPLPGSTAPGVRRATRDDHAAILAMDAAATGADRSILLTALLARAESVVLADDGFAIAWNPGESRVIGPVVAPNEVVARDLILAAADGADRDVRLDVLDAHAGLRPWLNDLGVSGGDNVLATMVHGAATHPGDRTAYAAPLLISMG